MPKRPPGWIKRWGQYLAARSVAALAGAANPEASLQLADFWGRAIYLSSNRRRQRMLANLKCAFPNMTDAELKRVGIASYQHLCRLAVEVVQTPRILNTDSWSRLVRVRDIEEPIKWINAGKPAIHVTGHFGNWEVLGYIQALMGYPVDALARPLLNPLLNRWLLGIREVRGLRIITKFDAADEMLAVVRAGGTLGFVGDQNAGPKGLFVPFFNRLASTYKSIGLLAIRYDVPIVCGYARRRGTRFQYEMAAVDFIRPQDWADQPDPLYYVTARYTRAIEMMVRRWPDQYLWMHRRWKSRPAFERQGKPMPPSLQRKLEQLPWMTPGLLDELKRPF